MHNKLFENNIIIVVGTPVSKRIVLKLRIGIEALIFYELFFLESMCAMCAIYMANLNVPF